MMFAGWMTNSDSSVGGSTASGYFSAPLQSASTYYMVAMDCLGPFRMKKTLYFEISYADDGIVLSNDEADLHAAGADMSEAKADLLDELHLVWREYACCGDGELDKVAREYKRWLLDNIEGPVE